MTDENTNGLRASPLRQPGWIERLLGRRPRENAFIEIKNLLATNAIRRLSPDAVSRVLEAYGIGADEARPRLLQLYGAVMRAAVRDGELDEAELDELQTLRHVLGLSDADVAGIERALLEDAYRTQLREAVGDSQLTDEEKSRLRELANRLRIPEDLARSIQAEEIGRVWDRLFGAAIQDRRLSEDEERYLLALAENLGVSPSLDAHTMRELDRFRLLWRIEQGELPEVESAPGAEPGERTRLVRPAVRYAPRVAPRPSNAKRVRLGRAVYWKLEQEALGEERAARWQRTGEGSLSVTDRRVRFVDGAESSLPLAGIVRFTVWRDGLELESDDGADLLFLTPGGDPEMDGAVLGAVLQAARDAQPAPGTGG